MGLDSVRVYAARGGPRQSRRYDSGTPAKPTIAPNTPAALEGLQSESCPQRVAISIVRCQSPFP